MSCNCYIGTVGNDELYLDNIDAKLFHEVYIQEMMCGKGFDYPKLTKLELLDNRRGYVSRFTYCPYCGVKIKWKKIKEGLKE